MGKLHICLKINFPQDKVVGSCSISKAHALWWQLMSTLLSFLTCLDVTEPTSSSGPSSCGQTYWNVVLKVLLIVHRCVQRLFGERSMHHYSKYWSATSRRILHFHIKQCVLPMIKSFSAWVWLPKLLLKDCHHRFIVWPVCLVSCTQTLLSGTIAHVYHCQRHTAHNQ
jgi:hypothetical protein